jgi:hypothetical protein
MCLIHNESPPEREVKKNKNTYIFQRRDLIKFWEQINLTPTNPVTSFGAQILIMKMLNSV